MITTFILSVVAEGQLILNHVKFVSIISSVEKRLENSFSATEYTDSIKHLENEHRILKQQLKGQSNK